MFSRIGFGISGILAITTVALVNTPSQAEDFAQKHPRRAEVLHRDAKLNNRINADKGHLGGHYNQLKHEDQAIHNQERADKNADGGHITKSEQHQLNKEENHLNNQIKKDHN